MPVLWLLFSVFLGQLNLIYALCSMPCKGCQWQKSSVTKSLRAVSDRNHLLPSLSGLSVTEITYCYHQSLRAVSDRNCLRPTVSQGCQGHSSAVTNSLSRVSMADLSSVINNLSGLSATEMVCYYQQSLKAVNDRNGLLLPTVSQGCQWQTYRLLPTVSPGCQWQTRLLLPSLSGLPVTEMVCCYQVSQGCQWQKWSAVTKSLEAGTEVPTNQPGLGLVCDGVTHLLYVQDFRATVKGRQSWKAAAIVTLFCGMVQTQPC